MGKQYISYGRQWIGKDDIKEVVEVLKSGWLTQGPKVEEFENALARYCKAKYAAVFSSGTAALHSAYLAANLNEGEVITTPLTFAATSNMLVFCGAKPVFVDIEQGTLNINPEKIAKRVNSKTKAIVTVDFGGNPCDYEKILAIAKKHNLIVIEDACHALGAAYKNKKVGSFADMTIFSFHPVKSITTGEGGAVITNNKAFFEKLKIIRNHGIIKKPDRGKWYYQISEPFFNYRITDIQCALGLSQLRKIDRFIKRRREIAKIYQKALKDVASIILPKESALGSSAWHIYPVRLLKGNRKEFMEQLHKNDIGTQVHYIPLHMQPFYKKNFGYKKGDFPVTEEYYRCALTLPLFPAMKNWEIQKVITAVRGVGLEQN